ncbi:lebercilin-like protein [Arapaima gigas]
MGSCNEHNCNTQEVSTIEYTERKNSGSSAQHGPTVDETANHENPSTEAVTDDGKSKGRDFSEEEQEALLQVLENYTDAENNGNKIQGGDLKPCQDDDSEWAEQDASNTTYPPQRPSSAILQTLIIAENAAVQLQRPHPEPAPLDPDLQHTKAATGEELCHPQ